MSGPHPTPEPPHAPPHPRQESATDVVRWAAFSCVLVPVVLLWYGSSLAGATGTALGLAAVTAVCRLLLHQSERGAARLPAQLAAEDERVPLQGHRQRTPAGPHHPHQGGRHTGGTTPVG
ncbi:hypothetical protein ACIQOU_33885 [Streptomyces sp. NPDC091279]|uniref:hypothetical protein n=1 Tax=unclassified Streptomyces TaxID=2593676 RepID=UPI00381D48BE